MKKKLTDLGPKRAETSSIKFLKMKKFPIRLCKVRLEQLAATIQNPLKGIL